MARDIKSRLIGDDDMSPAFRSASRSADNLAGSMDKSGRAARQMALNVEAANLRVEKATKAASVATQRYGKDSLKAREASTKLAQEQLHLETTLAAAAHSADDTTDAVDRTDKSFKRLPGSIGSANNSLKGFSSQALTTGRRLGGFIALGASAVSLAGPLSTGLLKAAHGAVVLGQALATVAPAAASLPALAAGALLVKSTIVLAGPAMLKAVHPVTDAWMRMEKPVGRLASAGLPKLSKEFVKVNFPAIRSAMREIARETNSVVMAVGGWVNSGAGQSAIRATLTGTLSVTRKLAEVLPGVATSFLAMTGRAGGPGFAALGATGGVLDRLATGAKHLFDSVSGADVAAAFTAIGGYASRLRDLGHAVVDTGTWMAQNQGKVKAFSDALAILGITLGALSGNWIAVAIGAFSLLVNHWDAVRASVSSPEVAQGFTAVRTAIASVSGVVGQLVNWFQGNLWPSITWAVHSVLPLLRGALDNASAALRDIGADSHFWMTALRVLGAVIVATVVTAIFVAAAAIAVLGAAFRAAAMIVHGVLIPTFRAVVGAFLDMVGAIVHGASAAFGWVPGIGGKLKGAANAFDRFRNDVNSSLGGITKTVVVDVKVNVHKVTINDKPVTIRTNVSGGSITSAGGTNKFRASGGSVTKGQAYWVGERREPEMFVPDSNGTILNRQQLGRVGGGGGSVTVVQQFSFPNYIGSRDELVRELTSLKSGGRLDRILA